MIFYPMYFYSITYELMMLSIPVRIYTKCTFARPLRLPRQPAGCSDDFLAINLPRGGSSMARRLLFASDICVSEIPAPLQIRSSDVYRDMHFSRTFLVLCRLSSSLQTLRDRFIETDSFSADGKVFFGEL